MVETMLANGKADEYNEEPVVALGWEATGDVNDMTIGE